MDKDISIFTNEILKLNASKADIIFIQLRTMLKPEDLRYVEKDLRKRTNCRIVVLMPYEEIVGKIVMKDIK